MSRKKENTKVRKEIENDDEERRSKKSEDGGKLW